jgi:hypothetical protein
MNLLAIKRHVDDIGARELGNECDQTSAGICKIVAIF